MPVGLLGFYGVLHNGWTEVASNALGPIPIEQCYTLSEGEWELDEDIDISKLNLDKFLVVFNNGGSGYLCADLQHPEDNCLIWWNDDSPLKQSSFWGVMDSWIEIGFEEE